MCLVCFWHDSELSFCVLEFHFWGKWGNGVWCAVLDRTIGRSLLTRILLSAGAKVDYKRVGDRSTALLLAVYFGFSPTAALLIEKKADVDAANSKADGKAWTPLTLAAMHGHEALAAMLLAAGAKVNTPMDAEGTTALILARDHGHEALVDALVAAGAAEGPQPSRQGT